MIYAADHTTSFRFKTITGDLLQSEVDGPSV